MQSLTSKISQVLKSKESDSQPRHTFVEKEIEAKTMTDEDAKKPATPAATAPAAAPTAAPAAGPAPTPASAPAPVKASQLMPPPTSIPTSPPPRPVKNDVGPVAVHFEEVSAAAYRIRSNIRKTPCVKSERLSSMLGMEVFCKEDYMQVTGSFKERGARNTLLSLSPQQKKIGVVAASAGNHALALAYHGQLLSIPVTVCMPVNAPITKVSRCRNYGAKIHMIGKDIIEARDYGLKLAAEEGYAYINGYDHPQILAGQGTLALEVLDQVPNIDAIVIPVGGGGLIAGCAVAIKTLHPEIEVIGVESIKCASWKAAKEQGKPVKIQCDQSMTLADGLCVAKVGENSWETAKDLVDKVISVEEKHIAMSVLRLLEEDKCVVEGAGATGLAAALAGRLDHLRGKRVVFPLCGGNIDLTVLGRIIERGMAEDGRLLKVVVMVSDRPGGLADLTRTFADAGASVKDIQHERAYLSGSVFTTTVIIMCEVRDAEHGVQLKKKLEEKYDYVVCSGSALQDTVTASKAQKKIGKSRRVSIMNSMNSIADRLQSSALQE